MVTLKKKNTVIFLFDNEANGHHHLPYFYFKNVYFSIIQQSVLFQNFCIFLPLMYFVHS